MARASYLKKVPPELLDDKGQYYPSSDSELMWLLSEQVKELVTQKLEPEQAERLLPELDRLFRQRTSIRQGKTQCPITAAATC